MAIPRLLRLSLELGFFAAGTWSLVTVGEVTLGWIYASTVLVHYIVSYDRLKWLGAHESAK